MTNEAVFYITAAGIGVLIIYDLIYGNKRGKIMIENEHPKNEEQRLEELAKTRGWAPRAVEQKLVDVHDTAKRLALLEKRFTGLEQRLYAMENFTSKLSGEFNIHTADPIGHGPEADKYWQK